MSTQNFFGIGIKLNSDSPNIPYFMFAGKCSIFCRTTRTVDCNVRNILDHYCKDSGQSVNLCKSKIQFSNDVYNA